ncbi:tetratricopeptide repeat protein [Sphaerisporangium corydalis]|uniref:tetratricopeptide repeat protein n=1 Tax=Sphaerisporangium corydalis TaxID=1441875 RepID=UPI0021D2AAE6|nr:tetratricopeptide repeat protein [Sphaerisporangium corydalis]
MAAERALGEEDAALAYEHAKVARRFAARIGVVREAVGLAAYRAGHYAEALSDLRAARRLTGSDEFLPIMADCERGLGRPERALDLVRSREAERLDRAGKIELAIVESGARRDLGQHDAAVVALQRVPELRNLEPQPWSARLAFAYADALAEAGHEGAATDWFERAMTFDENGETDAAERYAELTGSLIEDLEDAEGEDDEEDFPVDLDDLGAGDTRRPGEAVDQSVSPSGDDRSERIDAAVDAADLTENDLAEDDLVGDEDDLAADGVESPREEPGVSAGEVPGALIDEAQDEPVASAADGTHDVLDGDVPDTADVPDRANAASADTFEPAHPASAESVTEVDGPAGRAAIGDEPEIGSGVRFTAGPVPEAKPVVADGPPAVVPELRNARLEPGMSPAFIEPDFGVSTGSVRGDVLDDELDDDIDDIDDGKPDDRR